MQVGPEEDNVPLRAADPGQSHAGGPGKFDSERSKGHRLACCLIIYYIKFGFA